MPRPIRPIRIEGNIAYVTLTQGHEAIIDAEDAEFIGQWNWCADKAPNTVYAIRGVERDGRHVKFYMHREILRNSTRNHTDHINGDGLDNRKQNLRVAAPHENGRNSRNRRNNTSGYKGVSWSTKRQMWQARIMCNYKEKFLGYFETKEAAYAAYCEASKLLHGEFGRVE